MDAQPSRLVITLVVDPLDDVAGTKVAVIEAVAGVGMNVHAALVHANPTTPASSVPEEPEPGPELLHRLLHEAVHPADRFLLPPLPHGL